MLIRAKDLSTGNETNIAVASIILFEPAANPANSKVVLTHGIDVTVDLSCRALRHAVKKAAASIQETVEPSQA